MTLDDGQVIVTLPDSLNWADEFEYSSVKQDKQFTVGDNLIISENKVTNGRPITLVSGDDVWVKRSVVVALMLLVDTVGKTYVLTLADGRTFDVKFNRDSTPLVAKPVWRKNVQDDDSPYILTLNLMEV